METISNKHIVADFYKKIVGQRDSSLINTYVREDYLQHSAAGKDGRQALYEMVEFLKTLPKPAETQSPVKRLIGDGDMVVIQLDINFMGKRMVVLDLFRLADGMLAEHWDAVQEIAADNDVMTNGTTSIDATANTIANKNLVSDFYADVFTNGNRGLLNNYLQPDYIEHNKEDRLDNYNYVINVRRIIGEGDFVVVRSEMIRESQSFALYEIFRLTDKKIVEHWSVKQLIPDYMLHNNGML
jgi:predicted SnoaL-like aldol condensation-catalyzing enzyme